MVLVVILKLTFSLPFPFLSFLPFLSGAGKSTLLDILAGRKTMGKGTILCGNIAFNGSERTRPIMRRSAYVTQDNVHLESLTVTQTLHYAASLRMENSTNVSRSRRVVAVAKMLGLDGIMENRVGGQLIRGISGGQLKRLSIAVEIIKLPCGFDLPSF